MGSLTVAALRKFGLAEVEGKLGARQIGLSKLGQELVFYGSDRNSEAWKTRARMAALSPAIHRDLWKKYRGELPTDAVILPHLVLELSFSESAAKELLKEFRRTIVFAQLKAADTADTVSGNEHEADATGDEQEQDEGEQLVAPTTIAADRVPAGASTPVEGAGRPQGKQRTVQIPYSRSGWALLQAEFPMSVTQWDQMIAVLEAMKPSLVAADE